MIGPQRRAEYARKAAVEWWRLALNLGEGKDPIMFPRTSDEYRAWDFAHAAFVAFQEEWPQKDVRTWRLPRDSWTAWMGPAGEAPAWMEDPTWPCPLLLAEAFRYAMRVVRTPARTAWGHT